MLTASRELDALIAEKVMGLTFVYPYMTDKNMTDKKGDPWYEVTGTQSGLLEVPAYSTDIAAAWGVVEQLCSQDRDFAVAYVRAQNEWCVEFSFGVAICREFADTAPLAICLAALQAVGYDHEGE